MVSGNRVVKCRASETETGPDDDDDKVMHLLPSFSLLFWCVRTLNRQNLYFGSCDYKALAAWVVVVCFV